MKMMGQLKQILKKKTKFRFLKRKMGVTGVTMLTWMIGHTGIYWAVLGSPGLCWTVVDCTGHYRTALGCINGLYRTVLD